MLSSVLMHCYEREGHGSSVLSPMSMTLIECLGTMCVDDTDKFVSLSKCPQVWTKLQVWTCQDVIWHKWYWDPVDRRYHNQQNNNMMVGVGYLGNDPIVANKPLKVQWKLVTPNMGCSQQWNQRCDITPMPSLPQLNSQYWSRLVLPGPGLCAELESWQNGVFNGMKAVLRNCNDGNNWHARQWAHMSNGMIRNCKDFNKCLEASSNPMEYYRLQVWTCVDVEWHKWDLNLVDKRYHSRSSRNLVLGVGYVKENRFAVEGGPLEMRYPSNIHEVGCAQQWNQHCDAGNLSRKMLSVCA